MLDLHDIAAAYVDSCSAALAESATPAKHPDTEILEWLDSAACYRWMIAVGGDREEELHKMRPWKIRDAVRYCIAARKQGGEK